MSEEMLVPVEEQQCPVMAFSSVSNKYEITLDEEIKDPKYYRDALSVLRQASEEDLVTIHINSCGGNVDAAVAMINAIRSCRAHVAAVLEGETHSAASLIALACPEIHVSPYSSMMIHHGSFGSVGTTQNVVDHVNFTSRQIEKLIRDLYRDFLTESELNEVIRNREIWLMDDEIAERLESMFEARAIEQEEAAEKGQEEYREYLRKMLDSEEESD